MNDVILKALLERVKQGGMTLEQVPIPYQKEVEDEVRDDNNQHNPVLHE